MSISNMQGNAVIEDQEFPAVFTAHWPSGDVNCCVKHAEAIHKLGAIMGTHVALTNAPLGAQCKNCIKESKIQEGK